MSINEFANLTVAHRRRDQAGGGMPNELRTRLMNQTFFTSTCMREFAVFNTDQTPCSPAFDTHISLSHGRDAYLFLLHTITGLNSSIPGETNVQGQIRKAWNAWRHQANADQLIALNPVMHSLFSDSRKIRQQHLQGIGGNSYGSLARKLLNPAPDARILFVGAGELARSILPLFATWETAVWNRHAIDATELPTNFCFAPDETHNAATWASHVILTTPPDQQNDKNWFSLLFNREKAPHVLHLGLRSARQGAWEKYQLCHTLDDLFCLRKSQTSIRSLHIAHAHAGCEKLASQRFCETSAADTRAA